MLLRHTALYFLAKAGSALANLLAVALFSRLLTPEQYGLYGIVASLVMLSVALFFQWIKMALVRFYVSSAYTRESVLGHVLVLFAVAVGLNVLVSLPLVILGVLSDAPTALLWVALALVVVTGFFELGTELMRARLDPVRYGVLVSAKAFLAVGLGAALLMAGWSLTGIFAGALLSVVLLMPWFAPPLLRALRHFRFDGRLTRELAAYGMPLVTVFVGAVLMYDIDRYQVAAILGLAEAGHYVATVDLVKQAVLALMMAISLAALPVVIHTLEDEGETAARNKMGEYWRLLLAVSVPFCALWLVFTREICGVLLGEAFSPAAITLVPWVVVGTWLAGVRVFYFDQVFHLVRRTWVEAGIVFLAVVLKATTNYLMLNAFGLIGVAYSGVLVFALVLLVSAVLGRHVFRLHLEMTQVAYVFIAAAVMAVACLSMKSLLPGWGFVVNSGIGVLVYLVLVDRLRVYPLAGLLLGWFSRGSA